MKCQSNMVYCPVFSHYEVSENPFLLFYSFILWACFLFQCCFVKYYKRLRAIEYYVILKNIDSKMTIFDNL